ncbi:glycosyltransferase [Hymenobacter taeanensis]|uniref:Glycosyltransferase n=1 Tax=Hymenobacter taeanensis TaxID=2735321 RepID=A0A6M6BJ37_9BACT|nr:MULTISPECIES: glycosyltransferase [Hymenobacter]QJX47333.1 glycosyltransferase [Hymenobacter taeanensis]UOQ79329.1 glycosyltransferase [Hymenobacter sp. 5414T-23]
MPRISTDLVLPCYNPPEGWAANLIACLQELQQRLPEADFTVYVVNDGSSKPPTEADIALLRSALPQFHYLSYNENRGKGYALRYGVQQAHNPYCLFTDIDFPYQEDSVAAVFRKLADQHYDIAVGARDDAYYAEVPAIRTGISRTLRFCTRYLLRLPVSDTQCGIKGFNAKGKVLFLQTQVDRYLFDLEFLFRSARIPQLRVAAVPVQLKPGIIFSRMNPRVLATEGFNLLKIIGKNSRRLNSLR